MCRIVYFVLLVLLLSSCTKIRINKIKGIYIGTTRYQHSGSGQSTIDSTYDLTIEVTSAGNKAINIDGEILEHETSNVYTNELEMAGGASSRTLRAEFDPDSKLAKFSETGANLGGFGIGVYTSYSFTGRMID